MKDRLEECAEGRRVDELLEKREADEISALENRWLVRHLDACGECGGRAVLADPLFLLTPLSAARDPGAAAYSSGDDAADLAFVKSGVDSLVRLDSFEKTLQRRPRATWLKIAASLIVTVSASAWYFGAGNRLGSSPSPTVPGGEARSEAGVPAPTKKVRLAGTEPAGMPLIENVSDPTAQVYQFSPTAPGEPLVVFVVSRNANL